MLVQIPGIAFGAVKDSEFRIEQPELWRRIQDYSISLARGRGLTVHINLEPADWQLVRSHMLLLASHLKSQPYPVRGLEGNVVMQSLLIGIGRIDDAL